jgi:S1-C subfamily serine protease
MNLHWRSGSRSLRCQDADLKVGDIITAIDGKPVRTAMKLAAAVPSRTAGVSPNLASAADWSSCSCQSLPRP